MSGSSDGIRAHTCPCFDAQYGNFHEALCRVFRAGSERMEIELSVGICERRAHCGRPLSRPFAYGLVVHSFSGDSISIYGSYTRPTQVNTLPQPKHRKSKVNMNPPPFL
jgi:hypothetical protein